jgi:hypothetical protein
METKEIKTFKCELVDLCSHCAEQCGATPADTATPPAAAPQTSVTAAPSDATPPANPIARLLKPLVDRK